MNPSLLAAGSSEPENVGGACARRTGRKATAIALVGSLLLAAACGGGSDEGDEDSTADGEFCMGFAELEDVSFTEVGLDPERPEYQAWVEDLRALDPPDAIADDWEVVIDIIGAPSIGAATEGPEREAFDRVETFVRDECGIDLRGEQDSAQISYDCSTDQRAEGEAAAEAEAEAASQPVQVVEWGFCTYDTETRYGVVLRNTTDETLTGVEVTVDAVDSSGTRTNPLSFARDIDVFGAGQEVGIGGYFLHESPPEVARLDVQLGGPDENPDPPPSGELVVSEVETAMEGTERTTRFTVTSTYPERLGDLRASLIYRDADGEIVGGYGTFIDPLDSGDPTPVVVEDIGYPNPAVTQADVYVVANVLPP